MPWVTLSDDLPDDPRVAEAGAAAFGLLVAMLCYSNRMLMDGFVPAAVAGRLVAVEGRHGIDKLLDRLGAVGLLQAVSRDGIDGYDIAADLVARQQTREKVLALRRERAEAGRLGGLRSGETRREQRESKREATCFDTASRGLEADGKQKGAPYPNPYPNPTPNDLEIQTSGKGERGKPRSGARAAGAARRKLAPLAVGHDDDDGALSTDHVSEGHATA